MKQLLFAVTLSALVHAQSDGPAFETASIKESGGPGPASFAPGRFSRTYITLVQLLIYAHQMSDFQVVGAPDWVRERRYDVQAKAEGRPTADEMRLMVRQLLAERFALKTHLETRDLPRYALLMSRSDRRLGPKLVPSKYDCPAILAARGPDYKPPNFPPRPGDPPGCATITALGGGSQTTIIHGEPISAIAKMLQTRAGRVVVDKTGLTGRYDVALETEITITVPGVPANEFGVPREGLSLFTALPEQLGLKLESERGPVDVLVIDSVELPTPN
jgi:uncharacterized protein (TIGR03435 family)